MVEPDSEAALLERIRAGDKSACGECIETHSPAIYRLALRVMGDELEAEEVVQETFLSAFKGIDRFDGRSELRTWLYRIAHNAALMRLRRARPETVSVEGTEEEDGSAPTPQALFDWCCLPEPEFAKAEVHEQLERAVAELPETLRSVFVLRSLEELSTEATAQALGVSEEVVKTRLHRARMQLRERMTAYFSQGAPA